MYYPKVQDNGNTRSMIDTWLGYNHNYRVSNGEFYEMQNLTSDNYPLMTPRALRPRLAEGKSQIPKLMGDMSIEELAGKVNVNVSDIESWIEGDSYPNALQTKKLCKALDCSSDDLKGKLRGIIVTDERLTYLDNTDLHYGTQVYDLSDILEDDGSWQNMYRFGAYLVMHPACVYVNLYDSDDKGTMGARLVAEIGTTITYTICDSEGNEFENIVASATSPEDKTEGLRWLKTKVGEEGLYIWHTDAWTPVPTCYIRIDAPGMNLTSEFKTGDVVYMHNNISDIDNGSQIQNMTNESIVVIGVMDKVMQTRTTSSAWEFYIERKVPKMDYVCCDKNRMWGCYYGMVDGEMVNEIYSSELGSFRNWYTYQGLASDSYAVTVGIPEQWTGCISYQGYPTFFKENAIFRVYGSMPSQYQINVINARGVQKGSSKSLAIVDEYLVYKSAVDVCVFDGSTPRTISEKLGRDTQYYDGVAGACLNKYYLEVQNALGGRRFFVYDFKTGIWTKEEHIGALQFTNTENGQLYVSSNTDIYGLGNTDNVAYVTKLEGETTVNWYAETGAMGYEYPDYKYVSRITLRAYVPNDAEIKISISHDDMPYQEIGVLRGDANIQSQSLAFAPFRCDHYKLKFEGHGNSIIYTLATTLDTGSEEDGY